MEIKCRASRRFLFKIDIEKYHESLKKLGVDVTVPLTIEYPCAKCKMVEVYEIYPTHYEHIKSYKYNKNT